MAKQSSFIFPIALDLGAKNTGVYAVGYPAGIHFKDFKPLNKIGFVAEALSPKDSGYKLIQADRTANRHARRNRTRNQQAKRLLKLVLQFCFDFQTEQHDISIQHFMNRRGFSYLDKGVNADKINNIDESVIYTWLAHLHQVDEDSGLFLQNACLSNDLFTAISQLATKDGVNLHALKKSTQVEDNPRSKINKALLEIRKYFEDIIVDLESGAKPRRKFFQNIYDDLQKLGLHADKHQRMFFNALKQHKDYHHKKFIDVFHILVSHISNFDLKLLNAILKNTHSSSLTGAELEKKLAQQFGHWITKLWVVSPVNGEQRVKEIKQLREDWKNFQNHHPNKIFDFLCQTHPVLTIPPYENHTNRRPPSCQTLILNPEQLNQDYPDWQQWLEKLIDCHPNKSLIEGFQQKLSSLVSGKNNPLVASLEMDARILHFILDASRFNDPFLLNEIWSQIKESKLSKRQGKDGSVVSEKIKKLLAQSCLDKTLLGDEHTVIEPKTKSFWHLLNKYYQLRRRTREGRYFIHYDNLQANQARWQREGNLLVMCHHRPRQLKHQAHLDIAVLLGLDADFLQEKIDSESDLEHFFKDLKTVSKDAQKAQKDYGIDLKAFAESDPVLRKLQIDAHAKMLKLAAKLGFDEPAKEEFARRNASIFTLAQLYSLAFGERSGFGKTCPVCAVDNAYRMLGNDGNAVASRLNTLTMRLIDGALKRILLHQAHHIANRLWPEIEKIAGQTSQITIPFILEQNKFDFSTHLPELKDRKNPEAKSSTNKVVFEAKEERIKKASHNICAYTGLIIEDKKGDIDHIIPRSGAYGILNDEANLIYCSIDGNRKVKKGRALTLNDLSAAYLEAQFQTSNISEIKEIIYHSIYDASSQSFKFGRYRQFIGLDAQSQIAFRHALFLPADDPVRKAVIDAMVHRNKSRVNGAQRYMAQLLADILIKKLQKSGLKVILHFDYFEISSNGNDEDSTVALRKHLRDLIAEKDWDIKPFDKKEGVSQKPYSHVIDAILAFMLALQEHQGEGALQVYLPENTSIWGYFDSEGTLHENMFTSIAVSQQKLQDKVVVAPQSNVDKLRLLISNPHVRPHHINSRMLFTQNALGLEFYDLQEVDGVISKGYLDFSLSPPSFVNVGTKKVGDKQGELALAVQKGFYTKRHLGGNTYLYKPNKTFLIATIFDVFSQIKDLCAPFELEHISFLKWLFGSNGSGQLFYYSTKEDVLSAPSVLSKKNADASKYSAVWQQFYDGWEAQQPNTPVRNGVWVIAPEMQNAWNTYCRSFLQRKESIFKHTSVKGFHLKNLATASGTLSLVRRKNGKNCIYQLVPLDNKAYFKNESIIMAKRSPQVVIFDKDILTKGYTDEIICRVDPTGSILKTDRFLDISKSEELGLDTSALLITATSKTAIQITGIPRDWFQENLLKGSADTWQSHLEDNKEWVISKEKQDETLQMDRLSELLHRKPRSDESIIIQSQESGILLLLSYRSEQIASFLKDTTKEKE